MGFADQWVNLIMMCVRTVKYAVLVNGNPVGSISPSRGIRQGDPISPYLFLICAEVLNSLLIQADRDGTMEGVPTSRRGPRLNHLFFADDSLLFCRASLEHWKRLSDILQIYESASGQRLNRSKTAIFFSRNTSREINEQILVVSGLPSSQRHDTYLGLPALIGKSRIGAFRNIKERVWRRRLQDWKLKFLSQAGKEILLKAVIQAIPTYSMGVFLLPKALCSEINSLMLKFWWGHHAKDSGIPWMSWSQMGFPKRKGGRLGNKPSYAWRSISKARELVSEGLLWRIGNGESTPIWGAKWISCPSTYCVQSPQRVLAENAVVRDLIDQDSLWWNQSLLEEIFTRDEIQAIISIPISATNQPDTQMWRGTPQGIFLVRSAYHLAKEMESRGQAESSKREAESDIWAGIWKSVLPNAVKNFMWRACQNILPTKENLCRRKISKDPWCPICNLEVETTTHILWSCNSAQDAWGVSDRIFQKKCSVEGEFRDLAEYFLQSKVDNAFETFALIARNSWFRHNEWIHEGLFTHPTDLASRASRSLQEFKEANVKDGCGVLRGQEQGLKWEKPIEGFYKANCDASVDRINGRLGLGVIIRDHMGTVIAARSITKRGFLDPTSAEILAMHQGAMLCKELGLQKVRMEGDAQVVVTAFQNEDKLDCRWGHLIADVRSTLQYAQSWSVSHLRRQRNEAAHSLAKTATHDVIDRTWTMSIPECICNIVLTELSL
ncbi:uncharacterized protein LOC132169875 [Corylus avellana]|uniref:uncharacterized protein LOC132169875 n=1 Tax=Corylus avellana TaxID=13451 RepID=UPI00286A0090|nr:uncharacterized protein LOC132169875 [Corylus avellana]